MNSAEAAVELEMSVVFAVKRLSPPSKAVKVSLGLRSPSISCSQLPID